MQRIYGTVTDGQGNGSPNATVKIYTGGTNTLAVLYDPAGGQTPTLAIANPMTADGLGRYVAAVVAGAYKVEEHPVSGPIKIIDWIYFSDTVGGATGSTGSTGMPGMDADDPELPMMIPGNIGLTGVTGTQGSSIPGADGLDGEDAMMIPGNVGATGAAGASGGLGPSIPGADGLDGEDAMMIPGAAGPTGSPGAAGVKGSSIPGMDGADPDEPMMIPGPSGVSGTAATTAWLFTQTNSVTVGNTVTETDLTGTGQGSKTLAANSLTVGKELRLQLGGYWSVVGAATLQIKIVLGTTTIYDSGAITTSAVNVPVNKAWSVEANIICRTTGAGGTVYPNVLGVFTVSSAVTAAFSLNTGVTAAASVDTTASQVISVTATWGAAAVGNTITCTNFSIETLD